MLHKVSIGNADDMDGVQGADQVSGIAEQLREELRQEEDDVSDMRQTQSCADPGLRCRRVFVFCEHQLQQEPCASATWHMPVLQRWEAQPKNAMRPTELEGDHEREQRVLLKFIQHVGGRRCERFLRSRNN